MAVSDPEEIVENVIKKLGKSNFLKLFFWNFHITNHSAGKITILLINSDQNMIRKKLLN